jgi:hypothetical protein
MLRIPFSIVSDESIAKKVRGANPTRLIVDDIRKGKSYVDQ